MTMTIEKIEFPRRETKQSKTKKSLQSKLSDLKKRKKPTKASFETYNFFPTNDPIQLCEKEINEISKRLKRKEASLKLEYSF